MKSLEFKTTIHNGIIEIPTDNPDIKDKEVNVIILWEEKNSKNIHQKGKKIIGAKKKSDVVESSDKKYTIQYAPELIVVNKEKIYELKFPLLCTMESEEGQVGIENKMLGIYAYGATDDEAVKIFNEEFDYLYSRYNELSDNHLTDDVIAIKSFLNHIVKK